MTGLSPKPARKDADRSPIRLGVAAFLLSLVVFAPASLLTPVLVGAGVQFRALEGGLWNGRIRGLTASEIYFGDAAFRFAPVRLLTGRLALKVEADGGAGVGDGVAAVGIEGVQLTDVDATFDLSTIKRYSMFGLAYDGSVRVRIDELAWSPSGCKAAKGQIWTNAFEETLRRIAGEGADLAGALACVQNDLVVVFNGENSKGAAEITVRITPELTYALNVAVRPDETAGDAVSAQLQMIGFEASEDALVYNAYGPLKGLGT